MPEDQEPRRERDQVLQPTDKPLTHRRPVKPLEVTSPARAGGMVTYYLCGDCGIVLGNTSGMLIEPGEVVACWNCGMHNELAVDSEVRPEAPGI